MLLFGCSSVIAAVNKRKAKFLVVLCHGIAESRNSFLFNLFSYMSDTELNELQCWMTLMLFFSLIVSLHTDELQQLLTRRPTF